MAVDSGFAAWLQDNALYATTVDAGIAGAWGSNAIDLSFVTPYAFKAGADNEAARQLALMGSPVVEDIHYVDGRHEGLRGQMIQLSINELDYAGGINCFVIGADGNAVAGMTKLTVLRTL